MRSSVRAGVVLGGVMAAMAVVAPMASAGEVAGQAPPAEPASVVIMGDGCTGVPDSYFDADFRPACATHDVCYSPASSTDRLVCDQVLEADLRAACDAAYDDGSVQHGNCHGVARTYYEGVRRLGQPFYDGTGDPS